jgi:hypothetical protein
MEAPMTAIGFRLVRAGMALTLATTVRAEIAAQTAPEVTRVRQDALSVVLPGPASVIVLGVSTEGTLQLLHHGADLLPAGRNTVALDRFGPWVLGGPPATPPHTVGLAEQTCMLLNPVQYWQASPGSRHLVASYNCINRQMTAAVPGVSRRHWQVIVLVTPQPEASMAGFLTALGEERMPSTDRAVRERLASVVAGMPEAADWVTQVHRASW